MNPANTIKKSQFHLQLNYKSYLSKKSRIIAVMLNTSSIIKAAISLKNAFQQFVHSHACQSYLPLTFWQHISF